MSLDPAFQHNIFVLRLKRFSNGNQYDIYDERETRILFIARSPHLLRSFVAVMSAAFIGVLIAVFIWLLVLRLPDVMGGWCLAIDIFFVAPACMFIVGNFLSPKRRVTIYRDKTRNESLVELRQDRRLQFRQAHYTVQTTSGSVLAHIQRSLCYVPGVGKSFKPWMWNLNRKRWYYADAHNEPVAVAEWSGALTQRLSFYSCPRHSRPSIEGVERLETRQEKREIIHRLARIFGHVEQVTADIADSDSLDKQGNSSGIKQIGTFARRPQESGVWVLHLAVNSRIDPSVALAIAALSKTD